MSLFYATLDFRKNAGTNCGLVSMRLPIVGGADVGRMHAVIAVQPLTTHHLPPSWAESFFVFMDIYRSVP